MRFVFLVLSILQRQISTSASSEVGETVKGDIRKQEQEGESAKGRDRRMQVEGKTEKCRI